MTALQTKFRPATEQRQAHIIVTVLDGWRCWGPRRVRVPYDWKMNAQANHAAALRTWIERAIVWRGSGGVPLWAYPEQWIAGETRDGYVWVWNEADTRG